MLGSARSHDAVLLAVAGLLVLLAVVDTGVIRLRTPMWRRQTPKQLFYLYGPNKAALLWGLDVGLVFTTFRVTSLSWAALAVTAAGLVPWWSGLLYAFGYGMPTLVMVLLVPWRHGGEQHTPEPSWWLDKTASVQQAIRWMAMSGLVAAAAVCVRMAVR